MPIWNIKKNWIPCWLYDFRSLINLRLWTSKVYVGFAKKVRAKHSDRKSTVSPIGYCPNASPLQDAGRWRRKVLNDDSLKILHLFGEKSHKTLTLPRFHIYSASPIYITVYSNPPCQVGWCFTLILTHFTRSAIALRLGFISIHDLDTYTRVCYGLGSD